MQLVSKISNLCDPDPPTLQTDDMQTEYRALHYSASCGKKADINGYCLCVCLRVCPACEVECMTSWWEVRRSARMITREVLVNLH